ncbi:hypothetical protein H7F15_10735 [Pontibacter sp. Tf4]|uniref:hypothetical protein n=1 Tax=Pontibacter sp. Tf4 TaxID=2761620 RepID=UPI001627CF1F|nr:hypothetical protein [Pontibacter sp. Tf4]MBB6611513.1 hypothetical protein [Pontibacter sp. Tf4]
MVYFQTDYLQVEHHSTSNVLITQWYGECSSLQYRQALIQIVRIARELQAEFAIMDRRLLQPVSEADLNWTYTVFAKSYSKLPLRKLAVIQAFDDHAEQQQQQLYQYLTNFIPTRTFEDLTSAYNWVTSVPTSLNS